MNPPPKTANEEFDNALKAARQGLGDTPRSLTPSHAQTYWADSERPDDWGPLPRPAMIDRRAELNILKDFTVFQDSTNRTLSAIIARVNLHCKEFVTKANQMWATTQQNLTVFFPPHTTLGYQAEHLVSSAIINPTEISQNVFVDRSPINETLGKMAECINRTQGTLTNTLTAAQENGASVGSELEKAQKELNTFGERTKRYYGYIVERSWSAYPLTVESLESYDKEVLDRTDHLAKKYLSSQVSIVQHAREIQKLSAQLCNR